MLMHRKKRPNKAGQTNERSVEGFVESVEQG